MVLLLSTLTLANATRAGCECLELSWSKVGAMALQGAHQSA
jgi:hypothetical protein